MLRRTENVQVFYKRDLWGGLTGKYRYMLQVGRKEYVTAHRIPLEQFRAMEAQSDETPVFYMRIGERNYWRFRGQWHTDNENLPPEQVHALLVTRAMRRQDQVNRAMTIASQGQLPTQGLRTPIPPDVRQLVWQRDGGRCVYCGSTNELQIDHAIPVSMGGSSAPENLQILCGPCNRRKGAGVG
jgi:5-methylcytosine-specific restriction endonuclease McrA